MLEWDAKEAACYRNDTLLAYVGCFSHVEQRLAASQAAGKMSALALGRDEESPCEQD